MTFFKLLVKCTLKGISDTCVGGNLTDVYRTTVFVRSATTGSENYLLQLISYMKWNHDLHHICI